MGSDQRALVVYFTPGPNPFFFLIITGVEHRRRLV
jgi:hypothetical protein